jgi:hypothetical protein
MLTSKQWDSSEDSGGEGRGMPCENGALGRRGWTTRRAARVEGEGLPDGVDGRKGLKGRGAGKEAFID